MLNFPRNWRLFKTWRNHAWNWMECCLGKPMNHFRILPWPGHPSGFIPRHQWGGRTYTCFSPISCSCYLGWRIWASSVIQRESMFTNEQDGYFHILFVYCSIVCVGFLWNRMSWYFINEDTWKLTSSTEYFLFWSRNSSLFFLVLWDLSLESWAKVLVCVKRFYFLRQERMQAIKSFLFPNSPLNDSQALVCEKSEKLQKFSYYISQRASSGFLCTAAAGQQMAVQGHQMADFFWNCSWVHFLACTFYKINF